MSQAFTVARVAMRELWITFRLLLVLVAFIGAGALVALVPATPAVALWRLAIGLGAATVVAAAVASWSLSAERTRGRTGWLVSRSVRPGTYLLGWFAATSAVLTVGLVCGAVLGWLAVAPVVPADEAPGFVAAVVAVAATGLAAVALALIIGALLPEAAAIVLAIVVCTLAGSGAWMLADQGQTLPGSGYHVLAGLLASDGELPAALRAAGLGLVVTAVLMVAGRFIIERADL